MNIKDDIFNVYLKSLSKIIVYIEKYDNYYFLSKIDNDGIKHFKQDINLEKISILIIENLKRYIIKIFRNIYYKIYKDNVFRKSFLDNKDINLNLS